MYDEIDPKESMTTFNKIAEEHEKERFQLQRSRQAQVAYRIAKIKEELYKLDKELQSNQQ